MSDTCVRHVLDTIRLHNRSVCAYRLLLLTTWIEVTSCKLKIWYYLTIFGLRLSNINLNETTLFKQEFFKSWVLAGKGTSPVLKRGLITSGESGSSSPVYQGPEASLDGMSDCRLGLSPGIDEFLMNMVRFSFLRNLRTSWASSHLAGQPDRRWRRRKKGKRSFLILLRGFYCWRRTPRVERWTIWFGGTYWSSTCWWGEF